MNFAAVIFTATALVIACGAVSASAQERLEASKAADPRVEALVGTWEGEIKGRGTREKTDRTLIIIERDGQLEAKYGTTGESSRPVNIAVEFPEGGQAKITFTTSAGSTVTLFLVKADWLSGTLVRARGGTRRSVGVPMQLLRTQK
ncbi:MAG: hypothetical protein HY726_11885 [Candidatus Rokubacteria bacterium]|nr:hypothetical protein [Candidatus Rokubacteria bacterium]